MATARPADQIQYSEDTARLGNSLSNIRIFIIRKLESTSGRMNAIHHIRVSSTQL